jgi:hypothetical protein
VSWWFNLRWLFNRDMADRVGLLQAAWFRSGGLGSAGRRFFQVGGGAPTGGFRNLPRRVQESQMRPTMPDCRSFDLDFRFPNLSGQAQ